MTITNFWLAAPSAAPTVSDSTAGLFQIAHRRVNPDGTYTLPSPIKTATVLPNTVTPQTYANPSDVFRDEFLASNDGGLTWRIVPRPTTQTGSQTIGAFDTSWDVATLNDTQESAAVAVDFGTFLAGDSQTKTIWIINRLQDFSSLTFSVLDQLNNLTDALNGILEISIVGVSPDVGTGILNTSFNDTKIYSRTTAGSGLFTLTANNPSAIKIELQLVNYPLTGLSENIDYQLSIVPNAIATPAMTISWDDVVDRPTTVAGYGITDAVTTPVETSDLNDGAVTLPKLANIANLRLLGNNSGSAAAPQEIAFTPTGLSILQGSDSGAIRTLIGAFPDTMPLTVPPEGLTLSWVNASTISISGGRAIVPVNSSNRRIVAISTGAFTKTITSAFTPGSGNGGRVGGALLPNTTYHVFIAVNSSNQVDFFLDPSVTGNNYPTGFANRRRIGAVLTDGSSSIRAFHQIKQGFYWNQAVSDFSGTIPTSTTNLLTLTVPKGLSVQPMLRIFLFEHGYPVRLYGSNLPISAIGTAINYTGLTNVTVTQRVTVVGNSPTNELGQIRFYADGTVQGAAINTFGWIDPLY